MEVQIVRVSYIIILGLLAILLFLTFAAPLFFKHLINVKYQEGIRYVFWVGLGYFFWGVYVVFAGYIYFFKKTKILGFLAIVNVVLNIALNYLLISKFGAIGAAYATCISFFVVMLIIMKFSTKFVQLPWFNFNLIFSKKND